LVAAEVDQPEEVGMGMNENTLRPRGKVGNIVAAEEAVAKRMMRIPIINDLQAIAAATHAAVKAEGGMEMKRDILMHPGKDGNIVVDEELVVMIRKTIIRVLRAVEVEAAIMMKTRTIIKAHHVMADEAVTMTKTKITIKDRHAVVLMMKMMTIKDRQAGEQARGAAMAEVGMEMKKGILRHRWKDGNIAAAAAGEIVVMTMMITIKDRHVVGAEVLNMAKVVDGTAMKIGIHAQPERAGVIVINI
jgi:hypothetical protein